tara:strand:- start:972 stop:1556 length:585 start_codon:yes stop_codon:yes gene_type:complete
MAELSSLCVYCGSRVGDDSSYVALADELGLRMAKSGISLVFGGGRIGLMGVVADAVLEGGGTAIGIIPEHLSSIEIAHGGLTEIHVVDSMHTRKQKMFELADAFAVLPGGLGTLDETMEILTWRQLGLHDKPVVVLNHSGYWQPLETLIRHTIDAGFVPPEAAAFYSVVATVDELFAAIATAPTPTLSAVTEPL